MKKYFVICSLTDKDEESGEPLFWSNDEGWVYLATATVFTEDERVEYIMTPGRSTWMELPPLK